MNFLYSILALFILTVPQCYSIENITENVLSQSSTDLAQNLKAEPNDDPGYATIANIFSPFTLEFYFSTEPTKQIDIIAVKSLTEQYLEAFFQQNFAGLGYPHYDSIDLSLVYFQVDEVTSSPYKRKLSATYTGMLIFLKEPLPSKSLADALIAQAFTDQETFVTEYLVNDEGLSKTQKIVLSWDDGDDTDNYNDANKENTAPSFLFYIIIVTAALVIFSVFIFLYVWCTRKFKKNKQKLEMKQTANTSQDSEYKTYAETEPTTVAIHQNNNTISNEPRLSVESSSKNSIHYGNFYEETQSVLFETQSVMTSQSYGYSIDGYSMAGDGNVPAQKHNGTFSKSLSPDEEASMAYSEESFSFKKPRASSNNIAYNINGDDSSIISGISRDTEFHPKVTALSPKHTSNVFNRSASRLSDDFNDEATQDSAWTFSLVGKSKSSRGNSSTAPPKLSQGGVAGMLDDISLAPSINTTNIANRPSSILHDEEAQKQNPFGRISSIGATELAPGRFFNKKKKSVEIPPPKQPSPQAQRPPVSSKGNNTSNNNTNPTPKKSNATYNYSLTNSNNNNSNSYKNYSLNNDIPWKRVASDTPSDEGGIWNKGMEETLDEISVPGEGRNSSLGAAGVMDDLDKLSKLIEERQANLRRVRKTPR